MEIQFWEQYNFNRTINSLNLGITTFCNRNCPACCCQTNKGENKVTSVEYIKEITPFLQGLRMIIITGGEPTTNPDFIEICRWIGENIKPSILDVATNGGNTETLVLATPWINIFRVTVYGEHTYQGCPSNEKEIARLFAAIPKEKIYLEYSPHQTFRGSKYSYPCFRAYNGIAAFHDKRIYGCCVAPGVKGAIGVPVNNNWKEEVLKTELPCRNCIFGESENQAKLILSMRKNK